MFELLGDQPTRARVGGATVMTLETELAGASRKLEDLRDPHANYNAMSLDGPCDSSRRRSTGATFLEQGDIRGVDSVIVGQPEFYQQLEKTLTSRPLADLQDVPALAAREHVRRRGRREVRQARTSTSTARS